eukprot:TRINITY_DN909_c0_g1_i1.p1 TRINITY_DN909_c0_g1~~TRINITY_DN909_c0_g1_i1.p1  ORF type:complete len:200 (+),score=47.59 TRINITY_DN909_c0_g1_i1:66-665(+)
MEVYDELIKILIIGDSGVGKSCLLLRYTDNTFTDSFISTIGVDFKTKIVDIQGKKIKMECWDTAGQERFQTITASYYRGASGIILVYDVTNRESFEKLTLWKSEIDKYSGKNDNLQVMILGNKCELDYRVIEKSEAQEYASGINAKFLEVSAKNKINVDEAFLSIATSILNSGEKPKQKDLTVDLGDVRQKKKGGLCLI